MRWRIRFLLLLLLLFGPQALVSEPCPWVWVRLWMRVARPEHNPSCHGERVIENLIRSRQRGQVRQTLGRGRRR